MTVHNEITYNDCEQLIKLFREYLSSWSWEEWEAAGAADKEEIVTNAVAEFGPYLPFDIDEAYELFYNWIEGLNRENFEDAVAFQESLAKTLAEWHTKKSSTAELTA